LACPFNCRTGRIVPYRAATLPGGQVGRSESSILDARFEHTLPNESVNVASRKVEPFHTAD
jgi:hypothetical protein